MLIKGTLEWIQLCCIAIPLMAGPWLFGAWEMWYFWPLALFLFAGLAVHGVRLIVSAAAGPDPHVHAHPDAVRRIPLRWMALLALLPFAGYGAVRFLQADVYMDAERMYLLFLLPALLGIQLAFGFRAERLRLLYTMILANLGVIGLYGIINHLACGSQYVLWRREAYSQQYIDEHRATGPLFCPDHYSGLLEIAFAMCLGFLLSRGVGRGHRILAGLVAPVAVAGVLMSKSRGGGMALLVMLAFTLVWGFVQWPRKVRWYLRLACVAGVALMLGVVLLLAGSYVDRFFKGSRREQMRGKSAAEACAIVTDLVRNSTRGRLYAAALRGWNLTPETRLWGIGPGMHQNLWPHIAASPDGDKDLGRRPSQPNSDFYSYEVHSDWLQLLEEYGWVGLAAFLVGVAGVFGTLRAALRAELHARAASNWQSAPAPDHPLVVGALLAGAALVFHSLGDFNLQIPAIGWVLAAVMSIPLGLPSSDRLPAHRANAP